MASNTSIRIDDGPPVSLSCRISGGIPQSLIEALCRRYGAHGIVYEEASSAPMEDASAPPMGEFVCALCTRAIPARDIDAHVFRDAHHLQLEDKRLAWEEACTVVINGKPMSLDAHVVFPSVMFGAGRHLFDDTLSVMLVPDVTGGVMLTIHHEYTVVEMSLEEEDTHKLRVRRNAILSEIELIERCPAKGKALIQESLQRRKHWKKNVETQLTEEERRMWQARFQPQGTRPVGRPRKRPRSDDTQEEEHIDLSSIPVRRRGAPKGPRTTKRETDEALMLPFPRPRPNHDRMAQYFIGEARAPQGHLIVHSKLSSSLSTTQIEHRAAQFHTPKISGRRIGIVEEV